MFIADLKNRNLPPVLPAGMTAEKWPAHRAQVLRLFAQEEYGFLPPAPPAVRAETVKIEEQAWAGKAVHHELKLSFDTPGGEFTFPMNLVLPKAAEKPPVFVFISFRPYPAAFLCPVEEIIDNGWGLAMFCHNDISQDADDCFASGIGLLYDRANDDGTMWAKISMWAFAASRVMDYLQTLDCINQRRIYVAGHSRLGKTALWCGANDTRFAGVAAHNSGANGVAVSRGKVGERLTDSMDGHAHWYCKNYHKYASLGELDLPFEQSWLAAMVAPRPLAACSAEDDTWADPVSEYISLYEASAAYALLGAPGFIAPAEYPKAGEKFLTGNLGYSLRTGAHFLSRHDWAVYMDFFNQKAEPV
jgi:hypothetical protein